MKNKNKPVTFFIFFILFILILILFIYLDLRASKFRDTLINIIDSAGFFSYFVLFLLIVLEVVLAFIPGFIIAFPASAILPPFIAGTIIFLGNLVGSIIAFLLSRRFGRPFIEKVIEKNKLRVLDGYVSKKGFWTLFMLRVNPLTSYDIFSYAAGLTKMRFFYFFIATFFGLIPSSYLQAYFVNKFFFSYDFIFYIFLAFSIITIAFIIYNWIKFRESKR